PARLPGEVLDLREAEGDQGPGGAASAGFGQADAGLVELLRPESAAAPTSGRREQVAGPGTAPERCPGVLGSPAIVLQGPDLAHGPTRPRPLPDRGAPPELGGWGAAHPRPAPHQLADDPAGRVGLADPEIGVGQALEDQLLFAGSPAPDVALQ